MFGLEHSELGRLLRPRLNNGFTFGSNGQNKYRVRVRYAGVAEKNLSHSWNAKLNLNIFLGSVRFFQTYRSLIRESPSLALGLQKPGTKKKRPSRTPFLFLLLLVGMRGIVSGNYDVPVIPIQISWAATVPVIWNSRAG